MEKQIIPAILSHSADLMALLVFVGLETVRWPLRNHCSKRKKKARGLVGSQAHPIFLLP